MKTTSSVARSWVSCLLLCLSVSALSQKPVPPQPNDEEYTKKIHEYLNDPRFTTELVDRFLPHDEVKD